MANVLPVEPSNARRRLVHDAGELARKLDLIEDRPDAVLTWSDVTHHARRIWLRLGTVWR